jgi:hypothetical protein
MQEHTVRSLTELIDYASKLSACCFRGQADASWSLIPSIYRAVVLSGTIDNPTLSAVSELERDIFREFEEKTRSFRSQHPNVEWSSSWERLCLAQHYGTPTRLLDWTMNLNIAAYFAVIEKRSTDCAVWCLEINKLPKPAYRGVGNRSPVPTKNLPVKSVSCFYEPKKPVASSNEGFFSIIRPPEIDNRITNQSGVFSVYVSFEDTMTIYDHLHYLSDAEKVSGTVVLHKLTIPERNRERVKRDLELVTINPQTVFRDLIGLGIYFSAKRDADYAERILKSSSP